MSTASTPLDRKPRNAAAQRGDLGISAKATKSGTKTSYSESTGKTLTRKRRPKKSANAFEFDPQLVAVFKRNFFFFQRVFSLDTYLRPLPTGIAQTIARSVGFFTRIFTQFWDPRGIKNAQTAMGIRGRAPPVHRIKNNEEEEHS